MMILIPIKPLRKTKTLINMQEDIDYVLVERPQSSLHSIKLLTGQYAQIVYTYGTVSIVEDKANDVAKLQFQFTIDECPDSIDRELLHENTSFINYIGDILKHILEKNEFKIGKKSGS